MEEFTIIKQNFKGEEIFRYSGTVLTRGENYLILEAFFNLGDREFHGMHLRKGDRFVETYYFDRWYCIFEIYNHEDDQLKGWYCDISSPAAEADGIVAYRDLALDLLVFPDGRQIVLDEDEFAALSLSPREHGMALAALTELQAYFEEKIRAVD